MMQRNWTRGIVGAHLASLILGGGVGVLSSIQVAIAWCLGLLVAVSATSLQGWVLKTWGEQGLWWSQGLKWLVWVTVGVSLLNLYKELHWPSFVLAMVVSQVLWLVVAMRRAGRLRKPG